MKNHMLHVIFIGIAMSKKIIGKRIIGKRISGEHDLGVLFCF